MRTWAAGRVTGVSPLRRFGYNAGMSDATAVTVSTSILVRFPFPDDPSSKQAMLLAEESGALDFWAQDNENGYSAIGPQRSPASAAQIQAQVKRAQRELP